MVPACLLLGALLSMFLDAWTTDQYALDGTAEYGWLKGLTLG